VTAAVNIQTSINAVQHNVVRINRQIAAAQTDAEKIRLLQAALARANRRIYLLTIKKNRVVYRYRNIIRRKYIRVPGPIRYKYIYRNAGRVHYRTKYVIRKVFVRKGLDDKRAEVLSLYEKRIIKLLRKLRRLTAQYKRRPSKFLFVKINNIKRLLKILQAEYGYTNSVSTKNCFNPLQCGKTLHKILNVVHVHLVDSTNPVWHKIITDYNNAIDKSKFTMNSNYNPLIIRRKVRVVKTTKHFVSRNGGAWKLRSIKRVTNKY
jgi:hypothetical protein